MIENVSPEEFLKIVDKNRRIHFEYSNSERYYQIEVKLVISGISKEGIILKTVLKKEVSMIYDDIDKKAFETTLSSFKEKLGVDITFGNYEEFEQNVKN